MTIRHIKRIIPSQTVNMGGNLVEQPLPVQGIDQVDPFLLIHHWDSPLKGGQHQREVGVGPHPHRGFSPVTFIFKGSLQHRDSLGNNAIVYEGGTQWMHAGKGITHSERPGQELAENGGENEFIQFWVNTPARHKMEAPHYQPISGEETPVAEDSGARIGVVAGTYKNITGPAKTYSPQLLLRGEADAKAEFNLEVPATYNCLLYVLDGHLELEGVAVKDKTMIWFENNGDTIPVKAEANTRFIVLSGEPIDETVTSYGPFVMNTQTEIMQALRDAQMGKMGVLIEEF
jgi:redox-sensitive bicupin YhaK (pirin superfamily)